jgi:hypothetical protein
MYIDTFSLSRDYLYLCAVLLGLTLGSLIGVFRFFRRSRRRDMMITLALCFFSGALILFVPAALYSQGTVFLHKSLLIAAGAVVLIAALAFSFPRAVAFPLILIGGLAVVWLGISFLRLPRFGNDSPPILSVYNRGDGTGMIRYEISGTAEEKSETFTEIPLEFTVTVVRVHAIVPVIGGMYRAFISEIHRADGSFLPGHPRGNPFMKEYYARLPIAGEQFPLSVEQRYARCDIASIPPGMTQLIYFDGSSPGISDR